jgi:transglutaminase-like putative cysteine protease
VIDCTDVALAFIVLARELGIPTRYVEAFEENWLKNQKNYDPKFVSGHIFTDVFVHGKWNSYEPKHGFITANEYIHIERKYVVVGRGLDFSELYLLEGDAYKRKSTQLVSTEDMRDIASKLKCNSSASVKRHY